MSRKAYIALLLLSTVVYAKDQTLMRVHLETQQYDLSFSEGNLIAKSGDKTVKGKLDKKVGPFSQWIFYLSQTKGFDVIVDQEKQKILYQKDNLEAGGPFLIAASTDAKYVVFDYGCCPTPRDFEVRTREGKVVFKNTYLNTIEWTQHGLVYGYPTSAPVNLNKETQACQDLGSAWKVQMYEFNGTTNKKLATPVKFECSN